MYPCLNYVYSQRGFDIPKRLLHVISTLKFSFSQKCCYERFPSETRLLYIVLGWNLIGQSKLLGNHAVLK